MKRRILSVITSVALSFFIVSMSVFADGPDELKTKVYEWQGKTYIAIQGPALPPPEEAVALQAALDEASVKESKLMDERSMIRKWLIRNYSDQFGGTYTDEQGNIVIQIKGEETGLEQKIKQMTSTPENLKVSYVKYSKEELYASKDKLAEVSESLGLEGVGINGKDNKVNVYVTPEGFETVKEMVPRYINEDMIDWKLVDGLKLRDKAYYLYPGEQIERPVSESSAYICSLAFNGEKNNKNVGVTAGHCGNGTWYDLSDGYEPIGFMNDANTSETYDAGSITYVSGVIPSYYLNGSNLTIGTFDYDGWSHEVGDKVKVHVTSGGGTSYGPVKVIDESYAPPGSNYRDLVVTELSGAKSGDSGGLVYSDITRNNKKYACIEGVFKGSLYNRQGIDILDVFSKVSNVYDGVGLSGVYVDPNY